MRRQIVALAGVVLLTVGLALGYDWYIHEKWYAREPAKDFALSKLIADIRMATRRYLDVEQAKADGYTQISGNVPLEGYHFHKPAIGQFDYARPSTLLYARTDEKWQLVGLEYAVSRERPAESPFPGVAWERPWRCAGMRTGGSSRPAPPIRAPALTLRRKAPSPPGIPTCG